ncbi:hypothetical protein [Calothrix sp. UHCC 0171]|uniref:hypothetical protein n=1 Tax=Calothrix sp. UHCC 0171 TaxID=3110245 RepID=UPI002B2001C5|nr:hypothetical protein [Calothrix sp. UHCC 0171]MEA5572381.1 hypothetical protein [Calothrix sp. UHCC 0171]
MTFTQTDKNLHFFLPTLKPDADVKPIDESGKWDAQGNNAFQNVATSLDYKAPREVKSVSSVPTMWARPVSLEMALHNQKYPIREQMIEQWRGMLAAIALAEVRGLPLKAQLVELGKLKYEEFARSLHLFPSSVNTLYTLENKDPWEDIYVFLWQGKSVGLSSPSTLVCPSEEGEWTGLSWWTQGRLHSPIPYLNASEKSLLWGWLENLRQDLNNYNGKKSAINMIGGLIDEFRADLKADTSQPLTLTTEAQFFGIPLNRGVLNALNFPVKAPERPSNIRLIGSQDKKEKPHLLIIDPEIAKVWNESPQNIWIHQGKTLAALNVEDLRQKRIIWQDVKWIEPKDLFLPEFTFVNQEDALPGAFLPKEIVPLTFESDRITPLIPLNPILLEYLTPEDLISRLKIQPLNGDAGQQIRVILDLPLAGMNAEKSSQNYRIQKDYPIKEENALPEVPVLEIWPNFRTPSWKYYYAFYYDGEYGRDTFQVNFPEAKQPHIFKDGAGAYQMAYLEQFPSYMECQTQDRQLLGLILLKAPSEIQLRSSWTIGVDFGTSFTNIYVNRTGGAEPLKLENLHHKVTEFNQETRLPLLYEYFIPEDFIPIDKPLPLSSVLTVRGNSTNGNNTTQSPIFDGRIYVPNMNFKPQQDWIKTNLKWEESKNLAYNQLFLKHLSLHITAIAAKNGVEEIQWSLSYPSAFSRGDRNRYSRTWIDLAKELQQKTGIKQISPEADNLDYFRSESLAVAQYFADQEQHDLVRTTCIDVGGGTSDISIWQEENLVHQCSVMLAGRDIFSQFLELNPKFLERTFGINASEVKGLKGTSFNPKLDVWLRLEGDNWLNNKRAFAADKEDFQGLIQLTAIGTAGLYYYVGLLLNVLHQEGKYEQQEITPVYVGGNGGRFLHWLSETGRFDRHSEVNELLSRMLSKASGFEDTEVPTRLSENLKDEVACGLVLNQTKLVGLKKKVKDPLVAGEQCEVNGKTIDWNSRLQLEEDEEEIEKFVIPKLVQLPKFLYDFHVALKDLEIEGIKPLKGYKRSLDLQDNEKFWRETNRELTNILLKVKGKSENIRFEPPYILGLKALLRVLGKDWAETWSK